MFLIKNKNTDENKKINLGSPSYITYVSRIFKFSIAPNNKTEYSNKKGSLSKCKQ